MTSRLSTYILIGLLLMFQAQLWIGRGSVFHVQDLRRKLAMQEQKNAMTKIENEQLLAEVRDLKDGMTLVEDRARVDLGMIKPDEIFVQYVK